MYMFLCSRSYKPITQYSPLTTTTKPQRLYPHPLIPKHHHT